MTRCPPSSAQANFSIFLYDVAKNLNRAKPNPKAEKRRLLSLLVVKPTLFVNFLNYSFIKLTTLKSCEFEKPGLPRSGFSIF